MLSEDRRMNSPQSVTRVIHILEALCASPAPVSLADLSRALNTPKSSLAALLRGLAVADFVVASEGTYRLGSGAFGLGSALLEARRRFQSSDLVREGMRRLANRSGETVLLAVRDAGADTMTYVEVIESHNAVRFAVSVGDRRPLYSTSGGRALLAAGTDDELRRYLKRLKPQRFTANTETDKRRIADAVAAARETGVAQTVDQMGVGATGTASAIRDASGGVIGALIVAAPSSRSQDRVHKLARLVIEEAAAISRSLGYRPTSSSSFSTSSVSAPSSGAGPATRPRVRENHVGTPGKRTGPKRESTVSKKPMAVR
jgi:DNA-binding IclR family transcriptional regulator